MTAVKSSFRRRFAGLLAVPALAAGLLLLPAPAVAGEFGDYDPNRHDRFLPLGGPPDYSMPNPGFLLSQFEGGSLTGIAVGTRGAILITPQHILTAAHFPTNNPQFRGSDGVVRTFATDSSLTVQTAGSESDLQIRRLSAPVDLSLYTPLPIAIGDHADFLGTRLYAFDQFDRAGANTIDGVQVIQFMAPPQRPTWTVRHDYFVNGTNPDRIGLAGGDSSHAALVRGITGELAAIGTHMAVTSVTGDRMNFSHFAEPYLDQINAFVGLDGYSVSTMLIPEPGTAALLGFTGLLLLRRRESCSPARLAA